MSIFAQIVAGEIPCCKVYENDHVLAFLDVNPISEGHTLVVPKKGAPTLDQLDDDSAAAIGRALPRICRAVMSATGASAYNILQNNGSDAHQAVMYVHFHVIPRFGDRPTGGGLRIVWGPQTLDPEQGAALAQAIAQNIDK